MKARPYSLHSLDYIAIAEISKRLGDTQAQEAYARKYVELLKNSSATALMNRDCRL